MRISTQSQFDAYTGNIQKTMSEYFRVQQQLSTGKRFEHASEDPLAASTSVSIRSLKSRFQQFDINLRAAQDYLSHTEQALGEMSDLTRSAYALAIQGASSAVDPQSIGALVNQVTAIQERLVQVANSQGSTGQYIFAGHKTGTKPFAVSGTTVSFNGDANAVTVEVRSNELMQTNLSGASTLVTDLYNELETLKTNLNSGNVIQISDQSVGNLQAMVKQVNVARGGIGAKMQSVEALKADNARRIDDFTKDVSELEDIDLAETFVRYQQAQSSYQAALQVTSKGMNMSLMDFMR